MLKNFPIRPVSAGLALLALSACASVPPPSGVVNPDDPYEGWNRKVHSFNMGVDKAVMRPVSNTYSAITPKPLKEGITNILRNIRQPWIFVNDLLQGEFGRAKGTFDRFFLNTVFGLGGIFDVAHAAGLEYHEEDFGQTLAVWGVKPGAYLVLPFLGPSNLRDGLGFGVDFVGNVGEIGLDKMDVEGLQMTQLTLKVIDARYRATGTFEALDQERDSYTFMRSAWLQNRQFEVLNGRMAKQNTEEPDLFDELEGDETEE